MYKSFEINQFRGFNNILIPSLARVNLITGKNNVGKTCLLEALFLHAGRNNPNLPMNIELLRGRSGFELSSPSAIWGWLFKNKNIKETIELTGVYKNGQRQTLRIRLDKQGQSLSLPFKAKAEGDQQGEVSIATHEPFLDLLLEYETPTGELKVSRAYVEEGKVKLDFAEPKPQFPCIYLTPRSRVTKESAGRFSRISSQKRVSEVVDILKHVDQRLQELILGYEAEQPFIQGDIKLDEFVPMHIMGEGMSRLLEIILAILDTKGGIVLIDEVENGLHYSAMFGVWKAFAYMARKHNIQIFATTHSWECAKSAHQAFEQEDTYDFSLYRLDRVRDEIEVVAYDRESLATCIEMNREVRG